MPDPPVITENPLSPNGINSILIPTKKSMEYQGAYQIAKRACDLCQLLTQI